MLYHLQKYVELWKKLFRWKNFGTIFAFNWKDTGTPHTTLVLIALCRPECKLYMFTNVHHTCYCKPH